MIVWHLVSNRWNSAITEYALSCARALEMAGHKCVFTPMAGSPAGARARTAGLDVRPISHFSPMRVTQLSQMAKEVAPDVIMTYGGPETVLSAFLRGPKKAKVIRFRGQALDPTSAVDKARHRLSHAHVDLILTPSTALARDIEVRHPGSRAAFVMLGVDEQRFFRVPPNVPPARPEALMLGRLDPVKGHDAVFKVFARVLADWPGPYPRPVLHVVGEPANLSVVAVEELARAAGLTVGDDVLLTSKRVADIAQVLSTATLGIVPSIGSEIIARVAEEFLLCGTPIVVSGVGSLEETLFDGAGFSYRGKDPDAAAVLVRDALLKSLGESEAAKVIRARHAKELFSLAAMGKSLNSLIAQLR